MGSGAATFTPSRGTAGWAVGRLLGLAAWALVASGGTVFGEDFLGVAIQPSGATYVFLADVHVRAEPSTKGNRVGTIKSGDRVRVAGKTQGGWLAVRQDGRAWGFVYTPQVMPLVDGALEQTLIGRAAVDDKTSCEFRIRFEGKSEIEGEEYQSFDYEVAYACVIDGKSVRFVAPMFLSEAPYQLSQNAVFQVAVDLLELYHGGSDVLSTVLLYDRDRDKVVLDGVSLDEFRSASPLKEKPAENVGQALAAAAELTLRAWNKKTFAALAGLKR